MLYQKRPGFSDPLSGRRESLTEQSPTESLILAQDERWRRASNMQVEGGLLGSLLSGQLYRRTGA